MATIFSIKDVNRQETTLFHQQFYPVKLIIKRLFASLLVAASLPGFSSNYCIAEGGSAGAVGAIGQGLGAVIPIIINAFGSAEVTAVPIGYKYKTGTLYRGVTGSDYFGLSVDALGNAKYAKISEMSGVENPVKIVSNAPFTIAMGGLPGDVPFAIRKHKCEMTLGDGSIFTATTDAKITYKVYHKYKANPASMSATTTAEFNFTMWDRERANCNEVFGKSPLETFKWAIANNGITYVTFSTGRVVNISHGEGSGNGVTW